MTRLANPAVGAWFVALAIAAAPTSAATIYEGFNYPTSFTNPAQFSGGTGWSGAFSGDPITVETATLTSPSALPSTGRAIANTSQQAGDTRILSRNFAAAFAPNDTVWMSFLVRLDNFPSGYTVRIGGPTGAGVGGGISGYSVHRGDGTSLLTGTFPPFGPTALMLVRFGPDLFGTRSIDFWGNPAPGALGVPTASTFGQTGSLSSLHLSMHVFTAFDEFRMDTNLANVFVPAPGPAAGLLGLAAFGARRRRSV